MEPKGHIVLDKYPGEWEIMPSYIEEPEGAAAAAACKWVSIRFENRAKFNLPTVFSILIYTEPETGFPLAIVDGTHHTLMRTGASGAVSVKWMARKESSVLALVGAGDVNTGAFRTCVATHEWKEVRVWSRTQATLDAFMASEQPNHPDLVIKPSTDLKDVVPGADVVVTGTTGETPVLGNELVEDGMHIAALGGGLAGNPGTRCRHPAPLADHRRRHAPVHHRWRDQRAAGHGRDTGERRDGRYRRGDHGQNFWANVGKRGHTLRFNGDRASGFRDSAARI